MGVILAFQCFGRVHLSRIAKQIARYFPSVGQKQAASHRSVSFSSAVASHIALSILDYIPFSDKVKRYTHQRDQFLPNNQAVATRTLQLAA